MAKCDICGKSVQFGNKVSHSNIKTKKIWKPNIKRVRSRVNGVPMRQHVCTKCLKSGKVERA
ncbi:MAG: 50S ribosomal protein L28 [Lachnospiraceae bacterium]|jgi:large subunit ribosomal protein L28|nr:50S ribosomal protein L28 [Lachnospiraceae bacterium]